MRPHQLSWVTEALDHKQPPLHETHWIILEKKDEIKSHRNATRSNGYVSTLLSLRLEAQWAMAFGAIPQSPRSTWNRTCGPYKKVGGFER